MTTTPTKPRGFAALKLRDPERFKAISSAAGKASTSRPFRDRAGLAKDASDKGVAARQDKRDA